MYKRQFQNCINEALDLECLIYFEEGEAHESSPNKTKEKKKAEMLNKASEEIKNDPAVKNILDSLGGKIVESSITPKES